MQGIFHKLISAPNNIVMDLNDRMRNASLFRGFIPCNQSITFFQSGK